MNAYMTGVIFGALIVGIVIGAIPAITGAIKGKIGLALGGFAACVASSMVLGALLAIPVCAVFLFLIFRNK